MPFARIAVAIGLGWLGETASHWAAKPNGRHKMQDVVPECLPRRKSAKQIAAPTKQPPENQWKPTSKRYADM